ncbi:T9SS type A sorting domain-containing protein [Pontibacter sp. Tf4]|uniref:T9SS type A sorting domain-containing protein n=1 Tax=Pontibacter sp. Tf4 TaxID=2761620 RepID=UPI0016281C2D|nr:T9SS type A sorting domain-containing protein [Pontibacter sp. Tf4]MBB6612098.1 T9SS type A sorting domain-containing protein [Pontibacter sp. Tf4]
MNEPLADLKTGGSYGHTDFAPWVIDASGKPIGSPLASYFDGKNFLFRVRLAGQSTASKGYSILIDSNNSLTGGSPNPGFEFEVVLATNFDVRIYDHRTNTTGGTIIFNGSVDQYSQKAIAGSMGGGDADYFYDFYVPMSAFGGAITETTPLRMTGVTVTSAKSGIFGVASDLGGVDDNVVSGTIVDAWKSIINNTALTTPTTIKDTGFTPIPAAAPSVNSPIYTNSSAISGSSVEAAGSIVTIYRNGVSVGTTTVSANGSWTFSSSGTTITVGNTISAKVSPTGKTESGFSSSVTVQAAPVSYTPCNTPAPTITGVTSNKKGIIFSVSGTGTLHYYLISNTSTTLIGTSSVTASGNYSVEFEGTGNSLTAGSYYMTLTPTGGGCTSPISNYYCYQSGNSGSTSTAPTIATANLTVASTSLTVNYTISGTTITLIHNGNTVTPPSTTSGLSVTYNISGLNLRVGDVFYARATEPGTCTSQSSLSNAATVVQTQSSAPTITGSYCGPTTIVTGRSTEAAGTEIIVFVNGTEVGRTTVNAYGTWTATISSRSSGNITATATAPNKSVSVASNSIIINPLFSATSLTLTGTETSGTIFEGSTSVRGNASVTDGSVITLYINGQAYVDKEGNTLYAPVSGGIFTFTNISPFELYAGAKLTVTAKASISSTCESTHSAPVTVACNPASTTMTAAFTAAKFCPNTPAYIKLSTSEAGVIYNIYKKESTGTYTQFGPSVLGTGSAITLQSNPVTTAGTIVQVKTIKVGAPCQYTIGGDMPVDLYPEVPKTYTVTATPESSDCANVPVTISVQAAETGYSYQLIYNSTKEKIGEAIVPATNGTISFPVQIVSKTTEFGVVIRSTSTGCITENTILKTITINGGPDVNRAVTTNKSAVCNGQPAGVTVSTSTQNGYTYRIYQQTSATTSTLLVDNISGTGSTVTTALSDALFTTIGTKEFYVTVSSTTCTNLKMTNTVTIAVTDGTGGTVSAGPDAVSCGSSYTLAGSQPTPGTGTWSLVTKPATAQTPTVTTTSAYNSTVTGLVSGSYTFRWTVVSACTNIPSSNEVTIIVNCPAEYSVRTNKLVGEYMINDVLASVTDNEGVKSAQLLSGSLPPGTRLNTSTGLIDVQNPTDLVANTNYTFTVRIIDQFDRVTDLPLAIRFYSSSLRPGDITPLPVELVYFTAVYQNDKVVLQWLTASELNNERFEVERSADGKKFVKIGTVAGKGTSNVANRYSFTDARPLTGVGHYRLRQVDFDGQTSYSRIVAVNNRALEKNAVLQAYPNPFEEKLTVTITVPAAEQATLMLYNMQGRQLITRKVTLEKGVTTFDLETAQLAQGIYILRISGSSTDTALKVMKR